MANSRLMLDILRNLLIVWHSPMTSAIKGPARVTISGKTVVEVVVEGSSSSSLTWPPKDNWGLAQEWPINKRHKIVILMFLEPHKKRVPSFSCYLPDTTTSNQVCEVRKTRFYGLEARSVVVPPILGRTCYLDGVAVVGASEGIPT